MFGGGWLIWVIVDNVNFGGELFVLLQVIDIGKGIVFDMMCWLFQFGFIIKGDVYEGIGLLVSELILCVMGGCILCCSYEGCGIIFIVMLLWCVVGEVILSVFVGM